MDQGNKLITVKNIESAGMYSTMAEIFVAIVVANRDIMAYQFNLKQFGLKVFKQRKREYLRATRHLVFFGKKTTLEICKESNEYGLQEMVIFINGFAGIDDDIIRRFLNLAHHSPENFLSAYMQVINGYDWSMDFSGVAEKLSRFIELMEEKLRGYKK